MSSTRKAQTGSPQRQERYASSAEFESGLMANLVARRCEVLKSPEEIELIFFLQYLSHREGGLKKVSENLRTRFRERIATQTMLKIGYSEKKFYTPEQADEIRRDRPFEIRDFSEFFNHDDDEEKRQPTRKNCPAKEFKSECEEYAADRLEQFLKDLCLDPKQKVTGGPWWFPGLIESLFEFQREFALDEQESFVSTALGKLVYETLDYSLHGKCLTLIDGRARTGKTFAAKKWIAQHPGKARFVEIKPGGGNILFFRAIAKALGLSANLNHKAHELRDRIEYVLGSGNLMLVFDEAQHAWPDSMNREALPFRVSWLMSMVNAGVPISLIVTNQFFHAQKRVERRSGWTSEQFIGRIAFYQPLPESLSQAELAAIVKTLLPEADANAIGLLADTAMGSRRYLAGIEYTVKRARYLVSKAGREKILFSDLKRAISEGVIPSDKHLAQRLATPEKPHGRRIQRSFAPLPPAPESVPADIVELHVEPERNIVPIATSKPRETSLAVH
jgi:hypothetical protein